MTERRVLTPEELAKLSVAELEQLIITHLSENTKPLSEGSEVYRITLAPESYRDALHAAREREKKVEVDAEIMKQNPFAPPKK